MADFELVADLRTITGKKVKQLRSQGIIPGVIYGADSVQHIQADNRTLRTLLRHAGSNALIEVKVADATRTVLVREVQKHVTRGDLFHIDFLEVDLSQKVTAEVDLVLVGESAPGKLGLGQVGLTRQTLTVEGLPGDLVDQIEVDATRIEQENDFIYVSDLAIPDNIEMITEGSIVIARFDRLRIVEEEEVELEEGEEGEVGEIVEEESAE